MSGRTAHAVELTLDWTARELSESLFETLIGSYNPAYNRGLGGLDGGYAKVSTSKTTRQVSVAFHGFSYVGGVTLSGSFVGGTGHLTIKGSKAAAGMLVATRPNDFTGMLGGVRVHFTLGNAGLGA